MRLAIVFNRVDHRLGGRIEDLASDQEMFVIPELVSSELARLGYTTTLIPANLHLGTACQRFRTDLVFNLAEGFDGTNGHEHLVPSLLEHISLPYTGADATAMLTVRDKVFTKQILGAYGIRSARHQLFDAASIVRDETLRFPLILKPLREEASHGISYDSVVTSDCRLQERVLEMRECYGPAILAEEYIEGRELSVGVWGNDTVKALPVCEFLFECSDPLRRFRSFEHKWSGKQELMSHPQDLPSPILSQLTTTSIVAHRALRCRDYSRADFRLDNDGTLYFLEHNFNPGIGPNTHGLSNTFTKMAEFAGVSFGLMLNELVCLAAARYGLPCR